MKNKNGVKNTVGPYPVVCTKVGKVGASELLGWIRSHEVEIQMALMAHLTACHRCKPFLTGTLRLSQGEVGKMSHAEQQALLDLNPEVCVEVAQHRHDLVDWLYSIRGTELFYDAQFHLGICDQCPATIEEVALILEIPD